VFNEKPKWIARMYSPDRLLRPQVALLIHVVCLAGCGSGNQNAGTVFQFESEYFVEADFEKDISKWVDSNVATDGIFGAAFFETFTSSEVDQGADGWLDTFRSTSRDAARLTTALKKSIRRTGPSVSVEAGASESFGYRICFDQVAPSASDRSCHRIDIFPVRIRRQMGETFLPL
jgi:hypothetical protein